MIKKGISIFIFTFFSFLSSIAWGQYTISGIVLDEEQKKPLSNVIIEVQGTRLSTITDKEGHFSIQTKGGVGLEFHAHLLGFEDYYTTITLEEDLLRLEILMKPSLMLLEEFEVTAYGERLYTLKGVAIERVDENYLDKYAGNTLSQTLGNKAGVNFIATGVGVSKPVIRGMSGNRIVINDRGVKQQDQQWGNDHGMAIGESAVGSIELIKGPSTLAYGSDGIAGVVNVNPPSKMEGDGLEGKASALYRSNNQAIGGSMELKGRKSNWFGNLSANAVDFGNYQVPTESFEYLGFLLELDDGVLVNTSGEEANIGGSIGYDGDWGDISVFSSAYHLRSGLFPGATGIPSQSWLDSYSDARNPLTPSQEVDHYKVILNSHIDYKKVHWQLDAGFQQNLRVEKSQPERHGRPRDENGDVANQLDLKSYFGKLTAQIEKDHWNYIIGVSSEFMDHHRDGYDYLLPNYNSSNIGGYGIVEWSPNSHWDASLGARYESGMFNGDAYEDTFWTDPTIEGRGWERVPEIQRDFGDYAWAMGASYNALKWVFRLNAAKTFRFPNAAELSINGVHHGTFRHEQGNVDLEEEKGYQFDFSVEKYHKNFELQLALFYNLFENYIYLGPSGVFSTLPDAGQIYKYQQADGFHTGSEVSFTYHITPKWDFMNDTDYVFNRNQDTQLSFPFTPPFSTVNRLRYQFKSTPKLDKLYIETSWRYTAAQNRVDRNELSTESYQLWQLLAGFDWKWGEHTYSRWNLMVDNLLNTAYLNHLSKYRQLNMPEQGRNIQLMLSVWW